MKIDSDSILYIVITIALLVISGLGSRRKKKLQKMGKYAKPATASHPVEPEEIDVASVQREPMNPFDRLEQILSGQTPVFETMDEESPETIVDEEVQIIEEIRESRQEMEPEVRQDNTADEDMQLERPEVDTLQGLFENVSEIRKAVIYSEIMNRKYE